MKDKKLKIDLSPLWTNVNNEFLIRFKNLHKKQKILLIKRIKATAKQSRIRDSNGPSIQFLYEILEEINPIIFQERTPTWRGTNIWSGFGTSQCYNITGYYFAKLCQGIYKASCLKRNLTSEEYKRIAYLSNRNWGKVCEHIDQHFGTQNNILEANVTPIEDLGMCDVESVRNRAERNGSNSIPDEILEPRTEIERTIRIDPIRRTWDSAA